PDTLSGMAAFEAARFNHSRTSPFLVMRSAQDHSALVAKVFSFRGGQPERESNCHRHCTCRLTCAPRTNRRGVVNRSENQIVTGFAPILSSYRGLLRPRASRRFRSGFRLRAFTPSAGADGDPEAPASLTPANRLKFRRD